MTRHRDHIVLAEGSHADHVRGERQAHSKAPTFTLRVRHPIERGYVAFVGCRFDEPQRTLARVAGCFPRLTGIRL